MKLFFMWLIKVDRQLKCHYKSQNIDFRIAVAFTFTFDFDSDLRCLHGLIKACISDYLFAMLLSPLSLINGMIYSNSVMSRR